MALGELFSPRQSDLIFLVRVSVLTKHRGVYMRKLAPARVSYWDDFLISYRVYIMTESFHILLFEGARVIQNRKHYACATRSSVSHRNGWSFRFYAPINVKPAGEEAGHGVGI